MPFLKWAQNEFGFEHRAAESLLCGKTHVRNFKPDCRQVSQTSRLER